MVFKLQKNTPISCLLGCILGNWLVCALKLDVSAYYIKEGKQGQSRLPDLWQGLYSRLAYSYSFQYFVNNC